MTDLNEKHDIDSEELVPEDDRVIGRAFRWSLLVIAVAAGVLGLALFLNRDRPTDTVVREIDAQAPSKLDHDDSRLPRVAFKDVTREAGVTFVHFNGAEGEKLLPETMGGGVAFLDYDNDGDQDLLLINADYWPNSKKRGAVHGMAVYRNEGGGRFVDATRGSGLEGHFYGFGAAVGDYDNDGSVDLFVSALGKNHLFRNSGGRFEEVTSKAGVEGQDEAWSSSAGFLDYDNDGDLDLFVCNYVHWTRQIDLDLNFSLNGHDRAYGPPNNFTGSYSYLYRNNGDGTFTDVSKEAGIQVDNPVTGKPMGKALALAPVDVDRDGRIDIVVANDTVQNFLFHNKGDGTFEEIGAFSGVGFDNNGKATGAMGIDTAYYRNDNTLAIGVGNFANEMTSFFVNQDDPLLFSDEASGEGVGSPSRVHLSFGLLFFDYDLDGRLDLLQANGHLEEEINQVQASQHYLQPAQLFWNAGGNGQSCFLEAPAETVGDLAKPIVGRAAAYADIDGDGDLDVVLTQTGAAPLLLRNDQALNHHWLRVKLRGNGTSVNRDGVGSWVELKVGGVTQRRQVMPTRSYLSQVELPVTFGLGSATQIDSLTIHWPDGSDQAVSVSGVDRELAVDQQ